ncbi:MAG: amino acid transporter [Verrucomicrobiales bacterium]|nr:amino acid transporter [Verrucomicrobiales bacterium]
MPPTSEKSPTARTREEQIAQDELDLRRLGYGQQLFREMGGFSNFAVSFSIITVLTGAVLLFGYGLKFSGPIINSVGWPIVSLFTLCVAASMAELASAYPTAGGLYFWSFRLGGPRWAWVTAWLNMVGQVTITAGINVGAATYLIGAASRIFDIAATTQVPMFGAINGWPFQIFIMVLIMIPQILINVFGIRLIARLNQISVWWHIGGVLLITFLLTFLGKYHSSLSFLFSFSTTTSPLEASSADFGHGLAPALVIGSHSFASPLFALIPGLESLYRTAPFALVFVLAMLQAQWTYTGYDASAHIAEETVMAKLNCAWGVFLSVLVSMVAGYILLLALTWSIPSGDIKAVVSDDYPVLFVVYANLARFWANLIAIIIGGAMWLCGASSITSMARMWYAIARDDGIPGSKYLKKINPTYRTPVVSILVTSVLSVLICLYAAAYFVVTSISTIALYLAYVIPIYLNWRNRRKNSGEFVTAQQAPWNLGKFSPLINTIAIVWTIFIAIIFSIPPNELVLWSMLLLGAVMLLYWFGIARKTFKGPQPTLREP